MTHLNNSIFDQTIFNTLQSDFPIHYETEEFHNLINEIKRQDLYDITTKTRENLHRTLKPIVETTSFKHICLDINNLKETIGLQLLKLIEDQEIKTSADFYYHVKDLKHKLQTALDRAEQIVKIKRGKVTITKAFYEPCKITTTFGRH